MVYDLDDYVVSINITDTVVTIRDVSYPLTTMPPGRSGRFHDTGQTAVYCASGVTTAKAEVLGSTDAELDLDQALFSPPTGTSTLFDFRSYLEDHPAERGQFFRDTGDFGWGECQELRSRLEGSGVTGIVWESAKDPGGINVAFWPPFIPDGFLTQAKE